MRKPGAYVLIALLSIGASPLDGARRAVTQGYIFKTEGNRYFFRLDRRGSDVPKEVLFESRTGAVKACLSPTFAGPGRCAPQMITYVPGWQGQKFAYLHARLVSEDQARMITALPRIVYGARVKGK